MTTVNVFLSSTTKIRRRFELVDVVEIETRDQLVAIHIDQRGARAAAEAGVTLLASARRQETEE